MEQQSKLNQNTELLFRPLTEGLGFHPFSDGLPYAPIAKGPRIQTPVTHRGDMLNTPLYNKRSVPQISVPVVKKQTEIENRGPLSEIKHQTTLLGSTSYHSVGIGYLIRRVMAYLTDSLISTVLGFMLIGAYVWQQNSNPDLLLNFSVLTVIIGFLIAFNWILTTIQEVCFKTSIGKRIFGLMLYGQSGLLFLRAIFFWVSLGFGGAGILWSLIDRRKCCWHDRFVGIQPK